MMAYIFPWGVAVIAWAFALFHYRRAREWKKEAGRARRDANMWCDTLECLRQQVRIERAKYRMDPKSGQ